MSGHRQDGELRRELSWVLPSGTSAVVRQPPATPLMTAALDPPHCDDQPGETEAEGDQLAEHRTQRPTAAGSDTNRRPIGAARAPR